MHMVILKAFDVVFILLYMTTMGTTSYIFSRLSKVLKVANNSHLNLNIALALVQLATKS